MDREYAQKAAAMPQVCDADIRQFGIPEGPGLAQINKMLADLENRLDAMDRAATGTADRVFDTPSALNKASGPKDPRPESANIPAIMSRIERLHGIASSLDAALNRLSSL